MIQLKRVGLMVRALCYGHRSYKFESCTRLQIISDRNRV